MTESRPNTSFSITKLQPEALAQESQPNLGSSVSLSELAAREPLVRVETIQDMLAIERAEGEGMSGPAVELVSGTIQILQQPAQAENPVAPIQV